MKKYKASCKVVFNQIEKFSPLFLSVANFYYEYLLKFVVFFFIIYWDDYILLFYSANVMIYADFQMLKQFCWALK